MKKLFVILGLSVATLVIVDACSTHVQRRLGQSLIDAGAVLVDAGADTVPTVDTGRAHVLADAGRVLVDAGEALRDAGIRADEDASATAQPVPPAPVNVSGSRIEIRKTTQVGEDGTRVELGLSYYDTMLKTACTPTGASDGSSRCIPVPSGYFPSGYFSDAACSVPVVFVSGICTKPAFFTQSIAATQCSSTDYTRSYHAGALVSGSIYAKGATCAVATAPMGYRVFAVGAELLPADLVKFTATTDPI